MTLDKPKVEKIDGIAPCVCKKSVGKIICIGLNYSDHAEETGMEVPPEPIIFFKATSAIVGPNDDIHIPKNSYKAATQPSDFSPDETAPQTHSVLPTPQ